MDRVTEIYSTAHLAKGIDPRDVAQEPIATHLLGNSISLSFVLT